MRLYTHYRSQTLQYQLWSEIEIIGNQPKCDRKSTERDRKTTKSDWKSINDDQKHHRVNQSITAG